MSTTTPALVKPPREQRFVLRGVDWPSYRAIAKALTGHHVRLTYDRGKLELMTISHGHERCSSLLGQFVQILTEELNMPRQSGGSTTLDSEDTDRAVEPDECFYLENEYKVRGKDEIDLSVDPPPDLAVEVEVSRSSINRMAIYQALRVPEVWRFDGENLHVYRLNEQGAYVEVERSQYFPFLPMPEVAAYLRRRTEMDETSLVSLFRQWVRELIDKR